MDPSVDPAAAAAAAAAAVATETSCPRHDVAVILGSGWAPAADALGAADSEVPMTALPGFAAPSAQGHAGTVRSLRIGDTRVLVMLGRVHAYEGHPLARVVHAVRTAAAAGVHTAVVTNAAGGIRPDLRVGTPVLISDQINLTGRSPLDGAQFVDMVDAYSPALREAARRVDAGLVDGVYAGLAGPQYETPAEIRMLAAIGADLVGMSTVHETIAARAAGLSVLGLSLVTNEAAGITGDPLDHSEVLAVGRASAARMGGLLRAVIAELPAR
ncbi:purine-nucleoside phosphorylase [Gordonia shandongensis]|uniref:purine-nucleoside phosphorylase n=1 Tax=Gordonia shandongensis TaxID=376351 RepID=UPI00047DF7F9|nr:purine-nucleoside phosphorylase [Gordonia shandongensis]